MCAIKTFMGIHNLKFNDIKSQIKCKKKCFHSVYLATKRAESEGIKQTPFTYFTSICDPFSWPRLWPFIQENNLSTVDNVCLNWRNVQILLNLIHPYHIMVRWPPYLFQQSNTLFQQKQSNFKWWKKSGKMGKPEWQDDLCDGLNRENREGYWYIEDSTYYIHSCGNQHVTCTEQRIVPLIMVSAMEATYCHLPQVPKNWKKSAKTEKINELMNKKA